ncbi:MAG: hypothetical protein M5U34_13560 [Chloroflexi bacterium]|nr:hypothetical protein [Chloroflexota bacterium]
MAKRLMMAPRRLTRVLANWVRQAERSRRGMAIVLSACPTPTMLRDTCRRGGTARRGLGQTPDDGSAPSHPGISELGETGGAKSSGNGNRIIRLSHPYHAVR